MSSVMFIFLFYGILSQKVISDAEIIFAHFIGVLVRISLVMILRKTACTILKYFQYNC